MYSIIHNKNLDNIKVGPEIKMTEVQEDDVALFLHTSGTTSKPKGVPLTHKNLATSIMNISKTYELSPTDSTLLVRYFIVNYF